MNKKIFTLLLLLTPMLFANTVEFKTNNKSFKNVKADTASIVFTVETKAKTREKAQKINNDKIENFLKQVKKYNVSDIVTKNFNFFKTHDTVGKPKKIFTNKVSFHTNIKVNEYENVISELIKADISGYSYTNKNNNNKDYNTLVFTLTEKGSTQKENLNKIDKKLKKIEKILNSKMYLSGADKSEKNEYDREYNYVVKNQISLKLNNLEKLNDLLDIANKNEIYLEGHINYTVSNLRDIYIKLYKESLDMAKTKALLLLGKEYKIKNIKNITENKRVVYRNNDENDEREISAELKAAPRNVEKKPNLEIPLIYVENDLDVTLLLDDGKKEVTSSSDFNIKSMVSKMITPDMAEISFNITTSSDKNIKYANTENVKALNKIKDILKLAKIKYEDIETLNYTTNKIVRNVLEVKNKTEKINQTRLTVGVKGITSNDYIDIVNDYGITSQGNYNKDFSLYIIENGKNSKQSFEKAKAKLNKLRKMHSNAEFEVYKAENRNIDNPNYKEVKKEMYIVSHSLKFKTKDINKLSLLVSILRELGLHENIVYGVSNLDKYSKDIYSFAKKDIADKKNAIENTGYVKVENIKKVTELNNSLSKYFYTNNYYSYNNREIINLDKSNKDILKSAYNNMQNIYIPDYNAYLAIDIIMGIK
ncbi:SIMPL domain-containing protein [Oceanivirga salmonicida]|uniref:SIMPL domain-containing protein n=1 Tax=Oceanivirga salmonicida TaxID=1769291 RepID=UPI0012E25E72|nr:SIMPL domain-containing protein [Oceanivirga salmonicida]